MPLALNGSVERKEREVPTKLVRDGKDFIYFRLIWHGGLYPRYTTHTDQNARKVRDSSGKKNPINNRNRVLVKPIASLFKLWCNVSVIRIK